MKAIHLFFLTVMSVFMLHNSHAQKIEYSVEKVWGDGTWHCAFTSIVEFKGRYYISMREYDSHIFNSEGEAEGRIRIISSKSGKKWESVALISKEGYDLRDPKLSVTPDNRLMVTVGGSIYRNKVLVGCEPHVIFSSDGKEFSEPTPIKLDTKTKGTHDWLWRVTWHEGVAYGVSYSKKEGDRWELYLYKGRDGIKYDFVSHIECDGFPNETTVRFLEDGRMALMIRRDAGDRRNIWATSSAPYTEWKMTKCGSHMGGPDFLVLGKDQIVAGGRTNFMGAPQTTLFTGNDAGRFIEKITLPSAGDNSYPGFLRVGDELWVSYYSCHETERPSIYLAKIPLKVLGL